MDWIFLAKVSELGEGQRRSMHHTVCEFVLARSISGPEEIARGYSVALGLVPVGSHDDLALLGAAGGRLVWMMWTSDQKAGGCHRDMDIYPVAM